MPLGGGVLHPIGEAIAAEPGKIHQVDILHVGARPQVSDQASEGCGLELRFGLFIERHARLPFGAKFKAAPFTENLILAEGAFQRHWDRLRRRLTAEPSRSHYRESRLFTRLRPQFLMLLVFLMTTIRRNSLKM